MGPIRFVPFHMTFFHYNRSHLSFIFSMSLGSLLFSFSSSFFFFFHFYQPQLLCIFLLCQFCRPLLLLFNVLITSLHVAISTLVTMLLTWAIAAFDLLELLPCNLVFLVLFVIGNNKARQVAFFFIIIIFFFIPPLFGDLSLKNVKLSGWMRSSVTMLARSDFMMLFSLRSMLFIR